MAERPIFGGRNTKLLSTPQGTVLRNVTPAEPGSDGTTSSALNKPRDSFAALHYCIDRCSKQDETSMPWLANIDSNKHLIWTSKGPGTNSFRFDAGTRQRYPR